MLGRALVLLFVLVLLAPDLAFPSGYPLAGWTLSRSSTDPLDNIGPATTDTLTVYLWLYCTLDILGGVSGAKFSIFGGVDVFSFEPSPGVSNSGTIHDLDLTLSGCPPGSFLAGEFLLKGIHGASIWDVCLGPGKDQPDNLTWGCDMLNDPTDNATIGYSAGQYVLPCAIDETFFDMCEPPIPVSSLSWGRMKSLYYEK
jgi:hypothetical protein